MTQALLSAVAEFGHGASHAEIERAQAELGVAFPPCYVSFLREFGWARVGRLQVYGLGAGVPASLDLLRNARAGRGRQWPGTPSHLLPVMSDDHGNRYFLDTGEVYEGHCPVVLLDRSADGDEQPTHVADDFGEWLVGKLNLLQG